MLTLLLDDISVGLCSILSHRSFRATPMAEYGLTSTVFNRIDIPDTLTIEHAGSEYTFNRCTECGGRWTGVITTIAEILTAPVTVKGREDLAITVEISSEDLLTKAEKMLPEIRATRDSLLADTDFLVTRHRDQLDTGIPTTLSAEQYAEMLTYRQTLRDFPATVDFDNIVWPTPPSFL